MRLRRRPPPSGGSIVIEQLSPDFIRRVVEIGGGASAHIVDRGDDLLADRTTIDGDRYRTECWIVASGHVRKLDFSSSCSMVSL